MSFRVWVGRRGQVSIYVTVTQYFHSAPQSIPDNIPRSIPHYSSHSTPYTLIIPPLIYFSFHPTFHASIHSLHTHNLIQLLIPSHISRCRVDVSPTDVSPTKSSWMLRNWNKASLGYYAPDRCVPTLDRSTHGSLDRIKQDPRQLSACPLGTD
jgi:hypothetical protein